MHKVSENLSKRIKNKRTCLFASPEMLKTFEFSKTHIWCDKRMKNTITTLSLKITSIESNLLGSNNPEKTTITNGTTTIQASIAKIGTQPPTKSKRTEKGWFGSSVYPRREVFSDQEVLLIL